MAEESGDPDIMYEKVKPEQEGSDPYKDTVDKLPVKQKKKWRLW